MPMFESILNLFRNQTSSLPDVPDIETKEGRLIANGICPECGTTDSLCNGPQGGISINMGCIACGHWFNFTAYYPIGMTRCDRLGQKDREYMKGWRAHVNWTGPDKYEEHIHGDRSDAEQPGS